MKTSSGVWSAIPHPLHAALCTAALYFFQALADACLLIL